jgi:acyl-CoA synthetase (AMP-forming)/AMP-acid ligase II
VAAEAQTLPALLARNSGAHGDKPAVVADGESITYADLDRASSKLAARLVAAGIGKSSRVGVLMPNGMEWVLSAVAAARVGACLVPLSTLLPPPELVAQLQAAAVTHLVAAPEFRGRLYLEELEEIASGVETITAADRRHPILPALRRVWSFEDLPGPAVDPELVEALGGAVRPADDLVILFTSGARAAPKGVIHTHGSSIRATAAGLACRGVGPDERLYIPMPFFCTGGFAGGLVTTLVAGATLLTEAIPEPEETIQPWPEPKAAANLLGLTESFGPYCADGLDHDMPPPKQGSCGRPFEGIEVGITDPDTGADRPPGAVGEIRLRGPNMMRAICGRTREETFDEKGFYPTGDLGALDTDGYLWYHGRLDDTFKTAGSPRN